MISCCYKYNVCVVVVHHKGSGMSQGYGGFLCTAGHLS